MNTTTRIFISIFVLSAFFPMVHANDDMDEYYRCLENCNIDLISSLSDENVECIKNCKELHLKKK